MTTDGYGQNFDENTCSCILCLAGTTLFFFFFFLPMGVMIYVVNDNHRSLYYFYAFFTSKAPVLRNDNRRLSVELNLYFLIFVSLLKRKMP